MKKLIFSLLAVTVMVFTSCTNKTSTSTEVISDSTEVISDSTEVMVEGFDSTVVE
jgi:uncharacterized lipoprotein NlpE involved in copper resistance